MQTDDIFVIVTLSGGGKRAAALSYAVLHELDAIRLPDGATLLDKVRVISAVSGGSFAAVAYGLEGKAIFPRFETEFLLKNVTQMFVRSALNPKHWALLFSRRNRDTTALQASLYDRMYYSGYTFADLLERQRRFNRPYIIINSTEVELGARFEWTQDQFDTICADLSRVPLSKAIAASGASYLSPIVIKTFSAARCGYTSPPWTQLANGPN